MYIYISSCPVPPAPENVFLYNDIKYVCAQGERISVLFEFNLVRIPH